VAAVRRFDALPGSAPDDGHAPAHRRAPPVIAAEDCAAGFSAARR
jgi:hypothetical protein